MTMQQQLQALEKKVDPVLLERMSDALCAHDPIVGDAIETMQKAIVRIDELAQELTLKNMKIECLENTIKEMKKIMVDADIRCEDCNSELNSQELEYGMCLSCARLNS